MTFPTPFAEVNALVLELLSNVQQTLAESFVGLYLVGSLTTGDFDDDSDIDVLVVTATEVTEAEIHALKEMHARLATRDTKWAIQVEISYIPQGKLRRYDPADAEHPRLDRGAGETLRRKQHNSSWIIQRFALRQRAIIVAGPVLAPMIDPVSADDLRLAMFPYLNEWAQEVVDTPEMLNPRGEQSYTVLSMCRILYTLLNGDVLSKRAASQWMKTHEARWSSLIDRAWIGRHHPDQHADPEDIRETIALVLYVHEQSQPLAKSLTKRSAD